jgi:hypothetical protein
MKMETRRVTRKFFTQQRFIASGFYFMLQKTLELSAQAPQSTTDLHRISLGLESGLSDQCIYSLCCFDACIIDGLANPVKDEGLWNRCESSLLNLLQTSAGGALLLHTLHTLSLALQLSDPESDSLVPRLVDILLGVGKYSTKERMLALRCLSVLELDDSETKLFQSALVLILEYTDSSPSSGNADLLVLSVSLMCRFIEEFSPSKLIPNLIKHINPKPNQSPRLVLACIGLVHYLLENKPDSIPQSSIPLLISALIDRINGPECGCSQACEACQGCLSCILRVGVHPVLRESLRPFINVLINISFKWKAGSPIAAQSLLNMMAGLLH